MGRPKGSGKKHAETAQETVHGTETPKVDIAPVPAPETPNIAPYDTCRFHRTEPTRLFLKGEIIPSDWRDEPFIKTKEDTK